MVFVQHTQLKIKPTKQCNLMSCAVKLDLGAAYYQVHREIRWVRDLFVIWTILPHYALATRWIDVATTHCLIALAALLIFVQRARRSTRTETMWVSFLPVNRYPCLRVLLLVCVTFSFPVNAFGLKSSQFAPLYLTLDIVANVRLSSTIWLSYV